MLDIELAMVSSEALAGGMLIALIVISVVAGCAFLTTPTASAKVAHGERDCWLF
jgi:hypothetical protein